MTFATAFGLIAPGAALLLLLYLIPTARPDPTRAFHVVPKRSRKADRDPERRRRRSGGIPI